MNSKVIRHKLLPVTFGVVLIFGLAFLLYRTAQPSADILDRTVLVKSDAELRTAIASAKPGTTIQLEAGQYKPFRIENKENLTLEAKNLAAYKQSKQSYEEGDTSLLPQINGCSGAVGQDGLCKDPVQHAVYVQGQNIRLRGLVITHARDNGVLFVRSRQVAIEDSVISKITDGQGILFNNTSNGVARNNLFYNIYGKRAHAIYAAGSESDNPRFIGNRGYNITGSVYQINAEDKKGDKAIAGAVVMNNIAHDGPFGGNFCGVTGGQFTNNLVYNVDKVFTFWDGKGLCAAPKDNQIYHNTLVAKTDHVLSLEAGSNYDIKNNILIGGQADQATASENFIAKAKESLFAGSGSHYLDYRLASIAASVIDKGQILGISADLLGNARPTGDLPDFGAFEFGAEDSQPTVTPSPIITALPLPSASPSPVITALPLPSPTPIITAIPLPTTTPEPPANNRATTQNRLTLLPQVSRVKLNWRSYKGSDGETFVVYRNRSRQGEYRRVARLGINQTTYTDTGFISGETYWYKVNVVVERKSFLGLTTYKIEQPWAGPAKFVPELPVITDSAE